MEHQQADTPKIGRPATGQMPKRYFRVGEDDWAKIVAAAKASEETTSEYLRRVAMKDAAKVLKPHGG
jgi:uncharacterized protein (DUF1778 family)